MIQFKIGESGRILNLKKVASCLKKEDVVDASEWLNKVEGELDSYEDSTIYEVVIDGEGFPPKKIFGVALSKHLGFEVKSNHFAGGEGTPCFKVLESLGFHIRVKINRPGEKDGLSIYSSYERKDVCRIFSPHEEFTVGAGKWGVSGIVSNTPLPKDFIFFVTLGTYDGNPYEDALTQDGVLIWKSQKRNKPESNLIQSLVSHNSESNNVYLFLRGAEKDKYTYLGPIGFKDWDPLSSQPVHMTWSLIHWPVPKGIINKIGVELRPPLSPLYRPLDLAINHMEVNEQPIKPTDKKRRNTKGSLLNVDWAKRDEKNREIGLAGELLILEYEKKQLIKSGRGDLAEKIEHVATTNSAAGFDILSYDADTGDEKYIEVKTTTGSQQSPFFISDNEVEVSKEKGDSYWIYRLYSYNPQKKQVLLYKKRGCVIDNFHLKSKSYSAILLNE